MKKLLVLLILVGAVSCGSIEKTAYTGLIGLKAGYVTAKSVRTEYCAPKIPAPPICADSKPVLQKAYDTILSGVRLLAEYTKNKTPELKAQLQTLIPSFTEIGVELIGLEAKFQ